MLRPGGYAVITDPGVGAPFQECDTFTCAHCGAIVFVKAGASPSDAGGWCSVESKPVCGPCADKGVCFPFEEQLRKIESSGSLLRAVGIQD